MRLFGTIFSFGLFGCFQLLTTSTRAQENPALYRDPAQPLDQRVENLLRQMTLEEKLAQIQCVWQDKRKFMDAQGDFLPDSAAVHLQYGIGQIGRPSEGTEGGGGLGRGPEENARFTNDIQRWLRENTRLGIPAIMHEECLHGHAARGATSFMQPIGIAGTWNPALVEELFTMTALEARVRGTHQALAPVVDVARDPRWGRFEETYGEDPYLVGEMGLAAVRGLQGRGDRISGDHLIATLKHMAGHGQPESGTNIAPANYSERIIREVFLAPFRRAVIEGRARSVMASYNEIDGIPSHANRWLLDTVLRQEWGFDGVVVADYNAIPELHRRHRVARDLVEAGQLALEAGVDIELPDPVAYPLLADAFRRGELDIALLDRAVRRILLQKFELGLFENPFVDSDRAAQVVGSEEHAALARRAAGEAIILLQNEGNLAPITSDRYLNIAVIGPNADRELLGGYSDRPPHVVTVLEGIRERVNGRGQVFYSEGLRLTEPGSWYKDPVVLPDPAEERRRIREAVKVARRADLIVLAIGGNELTSREAWSEGHMGDRASLQLFGLQDELIDALAATGKPIVALLFNGRPLSVTNLQNKAAAIFECWYLGQETGHAVADVLFGQVNPSGKLPASIPRSVGHVPVYYNYKPTARRGYLLDEASPLWAFGYGLSYTTFALSEPRLDRSTIGAAETVRVSVDVTNTHHTPGQEVVQLYIRDRYSSVTRPVKELKDFRKIALLPGETKTVVFDLTPDKLAFWNIDMQWLVEPGEFDILVGNSSRDEDLKTVTLTVK